MIAWLVLVAITILPELAGYSPFRRIGGRVGRNGLFYWRVPVAAVTIGQDQSPAGREAQERGDFVFRWLVAFLLSLPVWCLPLSAGGQLLAAVLVCAAALWSEAWESFFELVGHNIEILVAERDPAWRDRVVIVEATECHGYRAAEIERMRTRDDTFRGWTTKQINEGLLRTERVARLVAGALRL